MLWTTQTAKETIKDIFTGLSTLFNKTYTTTEANWQKVATQVPSTKRSNSYAWLGKFPKMRKWLGTKVVKKLKGHGYTILNEPYEATVEIDRDDIEDDEMSLFPLMSQAAGEEAKQWPDDLVFNVLTKGFVEKCFDGKAFYAANHPVSEGKNLKAVSNVSDKKLSWASLAEAQASYGAARTAMLDMKDENGRSLKVNPNLLVVPPHLADTAKALLTSSKFQDGTENIYKGTAELLVVVLDTDTEWHLLATSGVIKPLIFQLRKKPVFVSQTNLDSDDVFNQGKFKFGVEARGNAGYGLWQQAYGSTGTAA